MRVREAGLTLVETLVALALLGACILMAGAVVIWAGRVEERASQHLLAVDLAGSIAERLRVAPYEPLASGELVLSPLEAAGLPGARATLAVEEDEDLELKRVHIAVDWNGRRPGRVTLDTAVGSMGLYK